MLILQNGLFPSLHPAEMAVVMSLAIVIGLFAGWLDTYLQRRRLRRQAGLLYRNLTRTNIELYAALAELQARGQVEHEMALWIRDQLSEQQILLKELRPILRVAPKEAA